MICDFLNKKKKVKNNIYQYLVLKEYIFSETLI